MCRALATLVLLATAGGPLIACGDDADPAATEGTMESASDEGDGSHSERGDGSGVPDGAREIAVTATSFSFEPGEITVAAGEDIAIALTSEDILHDFIIDELDAHVAAEAGETATGGFRADEPGRYTFYCSVTGHREAGMEGTLTVEG